MEFTYDPQHNVAYIRFGTKSQEVETLRISEELNVDLAPDGTVYGIELLNANEQLRREHADKSQFLNEKTGQRVELPLG